MNKPTFNVHLRIRPLKLEEKKKETIRCFRVDENKTMRIDSHKQPRHNGKTFGFDSILEETKGQLDVFNEVISHRISRLFEGESFVCFTYGVTNSGKTYTIHGNVGNPGIMNLTIGTLFEIISDQIDISPSYRPNMFNSNAPMMSTDKNEMMKLRKELLQSKFIEKQSNDRTILLKQIRQMIVSNEKEMENINQFQMLMETIPREEAKYSLWFSAAEIYNDLVYDLLTTINTRTHIDTRSPHSIKEDMQHNCFIGNLRELFVQSFDEILSLISIARRNLKVATTKLNHNSSRSHTLFIIKLLILQPKSEEFHSQAKRKKDDLSSNRIRLKRPPKVLLITFCDLAGAERTSKTEAKNLQLKEACHINTSLLTLKRCLHTLKTINESNNSNNSTLNSTKSLESCKNIRIPFRDSKLTRVLQPFFVGSTKAIVDRNVSIYNSWLANVVMIANIAPLSSVLEETIQVLLFSSLTQNIILPSKQYRLKVKEVNVTPFKSESIEKKQNVPIMTMDLLKKLATEELEKEEISKIEKTMESSVLHNSDISSEQLSTEPFNDISSGMAEENESLKLAVVKLLDRVNELNVQLENERNLFQKRLQEKDEYHTKLYEYFTEEFTKLIESSHMSREKNFDDGNKENNTTDDSDIFELTNRFAHENESFVQDIELLKNVRKSLHKNKFL